MFRVQGVMTPVYCSMVAGVTIVLINLLISGVISTSILVKMMIVVPKP